jgi:hypothetical protein
MQRPIVSCSMRPLVKVSLPSHGLSQGFQAADAAGLVDLGDIHADGRGPDVDDGRRALPVPRRFPSRRVPPDSAARAAAPMATALSPSSAGTILSPLVKAGMIRAMTVSRTSSTMRSGRASTSPPPRTMTSGARRFTASAAAAPMWRAGGADDVFNGGVAALDGSGQGPALVIRRCPFRRETEGPAPPLDRRPPRPRPIWPAGWPCFPGNRVARSRTGGPQAGL